jgi:hypothetical protein
MKYNSEGVFKTFREYLFLFAKEIQVNFDMKWTRALRITRNDGVDNDDCDDNDAL